MEPGAKQMATDRTTFLQHYRLSLAPDGAPRELRAGGAPAYEAADERTGERVRLVLIPVESIPSEAREQFEQQLSAASKLRHANVASVLEFGRDGADYVYVAEHLSGDSLSAWVAEHGPMPADAGLRVAEQIVSVLSSANFHKLPYPDIEPRNILIVPGQTAEGGWPLIKLINFGLPASRPGAAYSPRAHEADRSPADFAAGLAPETYSLGATLYFLLTGAELSGERPKFSGFPKPLRRLLGHLLHPDAACRPKDLVVLAELVRGCLSKIERRRTLAERYGLPLKTTVSPRQEKRANFWRRPLTVSAVLIALALIAVALFSGPVSRIAGRNRGAKTIGVLVGVPDSSPVPAAQDASTAAAPVEALSQAVNAVLPPANEASAGGNATSDSPQSASPGEPQTSVAHTETTAPADAPATPQTAAPANAGQTETNFSARTDTSTAPTEKVTSQGSRVEEKRTASKSKRASQTQSLAEGRPRRRANAIGARTIGITSDGRLILRLRSGRIAIVAPDADEEQYVPRYRRRVFIPRGEMFARPPQFWPDDYP
jgi:serine/threonine protein kinase